MDKVNGEDNNASSPQDSDAVNDIVQEDTKVPQQSKARLSTSNKTLDLLTRSFTPSSKARSRANIENILPLDHVSASSRNNSVEMFFVDTVGEQPAVRQSPLPQIRSPSPASSDFSDEVVFHGRTAQHARIVDDPIAPLKTDDKPSALLVPHLTDNNSQTNVTSHNSWDDTPDNWVHRSKPGVGWMMPKAKPKPTPKSRLLTFPSQAEFEMSQDTLAIDDYLENIREHDPDILNTTPLTQRDIDVELDDGGYVHSQFKSLSVTGSKQREAPFVESSVVFDEADDADNSDTDATEDQDDIIDEASSSVNSDEDDGTDEYDVEVVDEGNATIIDDETLATLLSKQEELGIGSDELLLYDDGVDASVARAAKRYAKETPKKSRRNGRDLFPSATLMADVLEQDPYGGFDIMDFDRPSLRKRKGKKGLQCDVPDEKLRETLEDAWDNDRSKKRERKAQREELRVQGLLGSRSVTNKYGEGMTIWEIGKVFESFLGSDDLEEKSFPPMDKRRRKMIHEIAVEFNLKTKSIGTGNNRYTKIIKTKTTTRWLEQRFVLRARKINMGFFPRSDASAKGKRAARVASRGGGANLAGVRYRDGDVVGGTAPEIGADNRGRAMLEKMGWTSGMALGTVDNKGILQPIIHVVKNTKTGLG